MNRRILLLSTTAAAFAMGLSAASAEVPRVVTDIPVVHSLTASVMGDLGTPALILDRGADPHSFQMRPTQARALAEAEVVFWVGPEMTPWLARALAGTGTRGTVVSLLGAEGVTLRDYAHGHSHAHDDHGHAHDDHGHDHAHDDHGHAHDGTDPHAWLYPANARAWLAAIAAELSARDPANAGTYAANAAAAAEAVTLLEAEVRDILAPVGDTPIVVFHDAYGYFDAAFGVNVVGTITLGDAAAPGAARLSELRDMLADGAVACIFPEVNHSPRHAEMLVEGTGTRLGGLLDPAGVALEPGPDLYATLLRDLATTIAACVTEG